MKKIFLSTTFLSWVVASEGPKSIIPRTKGCSMIHLEQFSQFNLDTQQVESQTPSSGEWSDKLTSEFNIWLDFKAKRALISHKKIRHARDIEMVRCNWPNHDKFTLVVRSEREKILCNNKMELKLADNLKFNDPINLDAFGYLFTFRLPNALPKECICQGLLINPASRDFFGQLKRMGCFSQSYKTSIAPAFNLLLAAKYRLLTLGKTE